jgi:hypothetical protein
MLTILSVGEDLSLLRTRAELLRKTGANVLSSTGLAADRFIAEWEFDAIVLCHSVRDEDARRIAKAARGRSVLTRILLLSPDRPPAVETADAVLNAAFDPGGLLRSVTQLLNARKSGPVDRPAQFDPGKKRPSSYPADIRAREAIVARFERRRAG